MRLKDYCQFCNDQLKQFERMFGTCSWCMSSMSDQEQQGNALLALDMDYSFCDDDDAYSDDQED